MLNISKHISYEEAITTSSKLDNTPTAENLVNMVLLANKVFEPLRIKIGKPIKINSFFRSPQVNKEKGGSSTSQHLCNKDSAAMDLSTIPGNGYVNKDIFNSIKNNLEFDQLINENDFSWIHVSYKKTGNRKEVLEFKNGKYTRIA